MNRVKDKVCLITGGARGLGLAAAEALLAEGAKVMITDLDAREGQLQAARLGAHAMFREQDVRSAAHWQATLDALIAAWGRLDVLVNNAGIGMSGPVLAMNTADWERILKVNLWSVIHGTRLFAKQMIAAGKRGQIVNVSSGLAFFPTRLTPAYNTTKAAVQMLSECLRAELAGQGIGVSTVYPGVVNTGIVTRSRFVGRDDAGQTRERRKADRLYQLRNLKPGAVARAIVDAVDHNRAEVRVGAEVHAIRWMSRLAPGLTRRLAQLDPTA